MNRKFLLLFSLLIVAIGVAGILINIEDDKNKPYDFVEPKKENEVDIVLAQSIRDLASGTLLTQNDYALKAITVPETSELIKNNISDSKDINSHLLKTNLLAGSYIIKELLASPDSDEFNRFSLQQGKVVYKFDIKQHDNYLLDALQVGDMLAFQLRVLETDKNKGLENGTAINTKDLSDRKSQTYSLNKIIPAMRIIRIKKYSADELSEKNNKNQKTEELLTGYIAVIIKTEELDIIHLAEKSGDTFLIPSTILSGGNNQSTSLYDIIPKLRTTRELRG
ncbi:MAG: tight adherance operon protein [Yersinia sp. (in: enterobacteria)]